MPRIQRSILCLSLLSSCLLATAACKSSATNDSENPTPQPPQARPQPEIPPEPPPPKPKPPSPKTLDGTNARILYVDTTNEGEIFPFYSITYPEYQPFVINHNTMGQQHARLVAPNAHTGGLRYTKSEEALKGWNIVAYGMALHTRFPLILPRQEALMLVAGIAHTNQGPIFKRSYYHRRLVQEAATATNGLIVVQTRTDDSPDSRSNQTNNNSSCFAVSQWDHPNRPPDPPNTWFLDQNNKPRFHDCIYINKNRGLGSYRGDGSSWAIAKMAGYAALLRQAAPTVPNGKKLKELIEGGLNEHRVFFLDQALTNMGFAQIHTHPDSPDSLEREEKHPIIVQRSPSFALQQQKTTLSLISHKKIIAFTSPSDSPQRTSGVTLHSPSLSVGFLHEHDGFLGRTQNQTLGTHSGNWLWGHAKHQIHQHPWHFSIQGALALGRGRPEPTSLIHDTGTILTTTWTAQVRYQDFTLGIHQPSRTERARIRLKHGEGTIREPPGREKQIFLTLNPTQNLKLTFVHQQNPGHDHRARSQWRAGLQLHLSW